MSVRAYVQVKQPEYGNETLSHWVREQVATMLRENGVNLIGDDYDDEWELEVAPSLLEFVDILSCNPKWLEEQYLDESLQGRDYGQDLLDLLNEGIEAAKKNNYSWITINWF